MLQWMEVGLRLAQAENGRHVVKPATRERRPAYVHGRAQTQPPKMEDLLVLVNLLKQKQKHA